MAENSVTVFPIRAGLFLISERVFCVIPTNTLIAYLNIRIPPSLRMCACVCARAYTHVHTHSWDEEDEGEK